MVLSKGKALTDIFMTSKDLLIQKLKNHNGIDIDSMTREIKRYMPNFSEQKFRDSYFFAAEAHNGQCRKNGEPYIIHPIETVRILISLQADEDTLIAALLHDVPEDTTRTIEEIEEKFGKNVAFLVDGITKLSKVHYQHDMAKRQIESLKKLFIHSAKDPRIILIKLADRLHNMRTLKFVEKEEKRSRIARETLEIFVPIANLLGIEELKAELEEHCFQYLFPDEYQNLVDRLKQNREKKQQLQEEIIKILEESFKRNKIVATVYGRTKNIYSVYKEMLSQEKGLDELDRTIWLRVLVQEKEHCYQALGILHSLFKPKPGKFKDYISVPKINGYQSLHTTVFGLKGSIIEFQIRSNRMHLEAEYGIASTHFSNAKSKKKNSIAEDRRIDWASKILAMEKQHELDDDFIEDLKLDLFRDRIFIFTPKGDAIDLPQGATCIDFAYSIHTHVGDAALKADVNGKLVPMPTVLQNGDTVRIITSDSPKGPNRAWLDVAKTNVAKHKIREFFKKASREEKLKTGTALLQKALERTGYRVTQNIPQKKIKKFCSEHPGYQSYNDILIAMGEGALNPIDFVQTVYPDAHLRKKIPALLKRTNQIIEKNQPRPIAIRIVSRDRVGQLEKILRVISEMNIMVVHTKASLSWLKGDFVCRQVLIVRNFEEISRLFENLEQLDGVKRVERLFWKKRMMLIVSGCINFMIWAAHPFLLHYVTVTWGEALSPAWINVLSYTGVLMLFMLVFSLRSLTNRSFPELKETGIIWGLTFLLSCFALITLAAEIYFFQLRFHIAFLVVVVGGLFAYLLWQYRKLRNRI